MPLDRETVMQIALSTVAVLLFIAGSIFVSTNYRVGDTLSAQGGVALVGVIAGFIVLMLLAGLWLERQEF